MGGFGGTDVSSSSIGGSGGSDEFNSYPGEKHDLYCLKHPNTASCNRTGGTAGTGKTGGVLQKAGNVAACASDFASQYSIAGGLQALGIGTSAAGSFVTNALGGNTFSGVTDLALSVASGFAGGHNVFYNFGQAVAAGLRQGIPGGSGVWGASASGVATQAIAAGAYNLVTGAGQTMQTLNGVASLSSMSITGAEFASGVGIFKFGYDALSYGAGLLGCKVGVIQ